MGKTRKGRGGRVEMYDGDKAKKRGRVVKTSRPGQKIWCENCQTKGVHPTISQVVKCFDRRVDEGSDFYWVRA